MAFNMVNGKGSDQNIKQAKTNVLDVLKCVYVFHWHFLSYFFSFFYIIRIRRMAKRVKWIILCCYAYSLNDRSIYHESYTKLWRA